MKTDEQSAIPTYFHCENERDGSCIKTLSCWETKAVIALDTDMA